MLSFQEQEKILAPILQRQTNKLCADCGSHTPTCTLPVWFRGLPRLRRLRLLELLRSSQRPRPDCDSHQVDQAGPVEPRLGREHAHRQPGDQPVLGVGFQNCSRKVTTILMKETAFGSIVGRAQPIHRRQIYASQVCNRQNLSRSFDRLQKWQIRFAKFGSERLSEEWTLNRFSSDCAEYEKAFRFEKCEQFQFVGWRQTRASAPPKSQPQWP